MMSPQTKKHIREMYFEHHYSAQEIEILTGIPEYEILEVVNQPAEYIPVEYVALVFFRFLSFSYVMN